jgi:hypothetical protein
MVGPFHWSPKPKDQRPKLLDENLAVRPVVLAKPKLYAKAGACPPQLGAFQY